MVALEVFLGALIAALGFILCAVGLAASRRTGFKSMWVSASAFGAAGAGGAAYVALLVLQGPASPAAATALAAGTLGALALFYFALFRRAE